MVLNLHTRRPQQRIAHELSLSREKYVHPKWTRTRHKQS